MLMLFQWRIQLEGNPTRDAKTKESLDYGEEDAFWLRQAFNVGYQCMTVYRLISRGLGKQQKRIPL
jgi:hypothetical protein